MPAHQDTQDGAVERAAWKKKPLCVKAAAAVLYHVYLAVGVALRWTSSPDFCHDVKFLAVVTGIVYLLALGYAGLALIERFDSVRHSICDTANRHRGL
ncbi:hypothetical protein HPB50_010938 [Hyalomma asiaticum]|uniref:Uncharacterized protein n=1 Tax=Hyalomma asiaticum TaxID=266040 RepID=A0ACB7SV37_HYAAI|nr:hypothetical protein HPB50_010938 [Hyalomma asiaticum]